MVKLKCKNEYFRTRGVFVKINLKLVVIILSLALILSVALVFSGCEGEIIAENSRPDISSNISSENTTSKSTPSNSSTLPSVTTKPSSSSSQISSIPVSHHSCPPIPSDFQYIKYKGQTLDILYDREFTQTEKDILNAFVNEYQIKVKITIAKPDEYIVKLAAMISGKDSPDIVVYNSKDFPGIAVRSLKAIDSKIFKLNDSAWDTKAMKAYTINGKVFGIVRKDSWQYTQDDYITYYSAKTLAGLADPYSLYKQGKWDYDAARNIAESVKNKGDGYNGMAFENLDAYMLGRGIDFMSYNKTYTNNTEDNDIYSKIITPWQELSNLNKKGLLAKYDSDSLNLQNTGLITSKAFGLYRESGWFDSTKDSVRAVPIATHPKEASYTVRGARVFGVAKGAKNVDLAAAFIHYFSNAENYKKDMFYNDSLYNAYINTVNNKNIIIPYSQGIMNYTTASANKEFCEAMAELEPSIQPSVLDKYRARFTAMVKRANAQLKNAK